MSFNGRHWFFVRVCSINLFFFVFLGCFHRPVQYWSAQPPMGYCITGGSWQTLVNPFSLLWSACLSCTWFYMILGVMLFSGISWWTHEQLCSGRLVGSEVLPNSHPYSLRLAAVSVTVVTMIQRSRIYKALEMEIHHTYYLVLVDSLIYLIKSCDHSAVCKSKKLM